MTTMLKLSAAVIGAGLAFAAIGQAEAQTKFKFTLDWAFQGPTSAFLYADQKGYYKAEGLDVTLDAGQGSAGALQRVATGAYEMGFADVNALIEYNVANADKQVKAVMMAYDAPPFGVYALKSSGIKTPKDLEGKKLGAPVFDERGLCATVAILGAGTIGLLMLQVARAYGAKRTVVTAAWLTVSPATGA